MADTISNLPDAILCHILSFLETKQSVATSILSKRWNHLWLSVLTLYFNIDVHFQTECFEFHTFIDSALLARDATLPIKSFHFNVGYGSRVHCPIISITKWVNFVVQRRVEYLYLHLNAAGTYPELPVTILTCKTLVVLKLFRFCVKKGYSSVVLPSLKTLHLKYIWFPKLRDIIMFLSGCPILEELHTFHVTFGSDESLTWIEWESFCLSNLTRADIRCTHSYFPLKVVNNTPSLCLELNQVNYPVLIPTFHNLTQLELISLSYSCQLLIEVLNQCPNLQKLDLGQATLNKKSERQGYRENWVDPDVVPQCLSLHLRTCNLFNFYGLQDELKLASYILRSASILQTMKIWYHGHHSKFKSILSSFPRASSTCKLTYG